MNGICSSWCYSGTNAVRWGSIPAEAACVANSTVYNQWSGPLGYCSFPNGEAPPIYTNTGQLPPGSTGLDNFGSVPAGTTFNTPTQVTSVQALAIVATITVFFAALAGCYDASVDEGGSVPAAVTASICSFIAWVFALSAFAIWSAFPYVQNIQSSSASSIWVPVWIDQSSNQLTAVQSYGMWYGPGWDTFVTAFVIILLTSWTHCCSLPFRSTPAYHRDARAPFENVVPNPPVSEPVLIAEKV